MAARVGTSPVSWFLSGIGASLNGLNGFAAWALLCTALNRVSDSSCKAWIEVVYRLASAVVVVLCSLLRAWMYLLSTVDAVALVVVVTLFVPDGDVFLYTNNATLGVSTLAVVVYIVAVRVLTTLVVPLCVLYTLLVCLPRRCCDSTLLH